MKNTLSKVDYIMANIFWTSVFFSCYCSLIFVPLAGFNKSSSILIFVPFVILCVSLCTFITLKNNRNPLSVFINALLPYQLFALISFWDYFDKWAKITIISTFSLSFLFFIIAVFHKKFPRHRKFFDVLLIRIRKSFLGVRFVAALCLSTFVMPIFCNALTDGDLFKSRTTAKISSKLKQFPMIFSARSWSFCPMAMAARGAPPAPAIMAKALIIISMDMNRPTPVRASAPTSGMWPM